MQAHSAGRPVVQDEGELVSFKEVTAEDLKLGEALQRVSFMQGDACNLAPKYTDYDLVFAGNLIDRLYDPAKFLSLIGAKRNLLFARKRLRENSFLCRRSSRPIFCVHIPAQSRAGAT